MVEAMMADKETVNQAIAAFHNLSGDDVAKLKELNTKIQNHTGKWGINKVGEEIAEHTVKMPLVQTDPLIYEFIDFMYEKNLLPTFSWTKWDEGSDLFASEDSTKYDNIDLEVILKLLSAAIRKERFADGTLAWAFESGGFPKLVDRLVKLEEA